MRDRKGNWMDLFASHALAVDAKKLWLGFIATVGTLAIVALFSFVYSSTAALGGAAGKDNIVVMMCRGECVTAIGQILPLFNPFAAGWAHFVFSAIFYLLLLAVWTYCGSTITRLTALQYARDDIPTLKDALQMVRKKRKAFFLAPVTPLLAVLAFALCNQIAGLVGSIPLIGPWILALLLPIGVLPGTIVLTFIAVLGVLSFGLMLPSISIGGKDAFEGWSSAYSYLLWGFNRFVSYTVLAAVIGVLSVLAAAGLSELFISLMHRTVSIGLIGRGLFETTMEGGIFRISLAPLLTGAAGMQVASWIAVIIALLIRMLVPAFAFSYFFTSNTIICFLMRKHVDRVDVDEVYYEEDEEEETEEEETEAEGLNVTGDETGAGKEEPAAEAPDVGEEPPEKGDSEGVNINTATLAKLKGIVHIGDEQAREIIEQRPFKSIDELTNVKLIGPAKLQKIKEEGKAFVE